MKQFWGISCLAGTFSLSGTYLPFIFFIHLFLYLLLALCLIFLYFNFSVPFQNLLPSSYSSSLSLYTRFSILLPYFRLHFPPLSHGVPVYRPFDFSTRYFSIVLSLLIRGQYAQAKRSRICSLHTRTAV